MPQEWDEHGNPVTGPAPAAAQEWDEHGKPIPAASSTTPSAPSQAPQSAPLSKLMEGIKGGFPFEKDVARGMGFDTDKISKYGGLEMVRELTKGAGDWMTNVAHDPAHLMDPIHGMASDITKSAGLPDKPGEGYSKPNYGQLMGATASVLGGAETPETVQALGKAGNLLHRHISINEGQIGIVNDMLRKPAAMYEGKVARQIADHAQSVLSQDQADMKAKGTIVSDPRTGAGGLVKTTQAAADARTNYSVKMGLHGSHVEGLIQEAEQGTHTMESAKNLTSQVGKAWAAANRAGKMNEAAPLNALYDGLHNATLARAQELGATYAKSWQKYIDTTRTLKGFQGGLLGDILDGTTDHADTLNKLVRDTDPKAADTRATEFSQLKKSMKEYGVDSSIFDKATEMGAELQKLTANVKANFMGRLKALANPKTAIPVAGAYMAGHAVGGYMGGLVASMVMAARATKLINNMELRSLLGEIEKSTQPSTEFGARQFPGRLAKEPVPPPTAVPAESQEQQFQRLFGPEYKAAGDLAEYETGKREGNPAVPGQSGWSDNEAIKDAQDKAEALKLSKRKRGKQ